MFFNANGLIRPKGFKATYYEDMMREIPLLGLPDPYAFVNSELKRKGRKRFVPTVGSNEEYTFRFKLDDDNHTTNIYCNDNDISDTFKYGYYPYEFSSVYGLKSALSIYFAILEKSIIFDEIKRKKRKQLWQKLDNSMQTASLSSASATSSRTLPATLAAT